MFGISSDNDDSQSGLIPRSCAYLFNRLEEKQDITEIQIHCSFLEIYNETLRDLLDPASQEELRLREKNGLVFVSGLTEIYVTSSQEVMDLIRKGGRNRQVKKTEMNDESSRSHSVFTLVIQQKARDSSLILSKLHFADLAGSERVSKSMSLWLLLLLLLFIVVYYYCCCC